MYEYSSMVIIIRMQYQCEGYIFSSRRDFHQLSRLVEQLVQEMGLLTLDGSLQASSTVGYHTHHK